MSARKGLFNPRFGGTPHRANGRYHDHPLLSIYAMEYFLLIHVWSISIGVLSAIAFIFSCKTGRPLILGVQPFNTNSQTKSQVQIKLIRPHKRFLAELHWLHSRHQPWLDHPPFRIFPSRFDERFRGYIPFSHHHYDPQKSSKIPIRKHDSPRINIIHPI